MIVELIHPPHPNSSDDRLDPPLGLLLIASYLRGCYGNGIEIRINDLSGCDTVNIGYADIYGVTSYATSFGFTKKLEKICRGKNPKCKFVVGGANPSAIPEIFPFADHVVVGEGEEAMQKIIEGTADRIVKSEKLVSPSLVPSFDLVNIRSYHRKINEKISLPILTSRGCPFRCAFCGLHKMHELGGVRLGDAKEVADNVEKICTEFGISAVNFQDDIFTLNKKRLFQLLEHIKPLHIQFRCMGRAGYDEEEVYEKLAEAGCVQVAWGIESGSEKMLNKMNKEVTIQDNYNVIKWAKKYNIVSRCFFIIGFPGETKETLKETMKFIEIADPDQYFVSNFIPYPGTPVWKDPKSFGITEISRNFEQYYQVSKDGTGGITISTEWLTKENFRELEIEFRQWMKKRPMRGSILDYEKRIKND